MEKTNIIFIVADQWRGDALGLLHNRHPVMTPHLDQLATEGIRFTSCYADCPICMPQRVTFLTGKTGIETGLVDNFHCSTPVDPEDTLPGKLTRQGGYQTRAIGKMHVVPDRARCGFEHVELLPDDYVNYLEDNGYGGHYRSHGLGGNEVYPAPAGLPEHLTHTRWITDRACSFLGTRDLQNPFFLQLIYEAPHSPFDPPEEYYHLYDDIPIEEPITSDWDLPEELKRKIKASRYDLLRPEVIKKAKQAYYASLTYIDYQLGRVLGELRTRGLYDNTLIIFTSDHGEHLGDYGLFGKTTFFNGSARVPLIIKPVKEKQSEWGSAVVSRPVMTADLFPTIIEAADLSEQPNVLGENLLPPIEASENRIIFGEFGEHSAMALDDKHKYIWYAQGGTEYLFDRMTDTDDLHNLADRSEFNEIKQNLKRALINHLKTLNRPLVRDDRLITIEAPHGDPRLSNNCAWRGPMRYGQGYGGGW